MSARQQQSDTNYNGRKIVSVADPTAAQDATTKAYVDTGDTNARARGNHTGTQLSTTISDFATAADARITALLGNVNNTSDANKPVSTQTQTALNLKASIAYVDAGDTNARARANHTGTQISSTISDFNQAVQYNRLDQLAAPLSSVSLNVQTLINVQDPIYPQDAATKAYVDSHGVDIHAGARVATTANTTLSGLQTIDGVALVASDRVLVKDQTDHTKNGLYCANVGAWPRADDADDLGDLIVGSTVIVAEGAINGGQQFIVSNIGIIPWDVNVSSIWVKYSSSSLLATSVVPINAYGLSSVVGTSTAVARADHSHGSVSLSSNAPASLAVGNTALVGTGTESAHDDHRHSMPTASQLKTDLNLPTDTVASLATEVSNRTTADTTLTTNLNSEVTNRTNAIASSSTSDRDRANHTNTQLAITISDFNTAVRTNRLDQMSVPTASVSLNGQRIVSAADPIAGADLATKQYVDTFSSGVDFHQNVVVATTGNISISSPPSVIDGYTVANTDRILVKSQTNAVENGIYVNGTPLTRAADANSSGKIIVGSTTFVTRGTANGGTQWVASDTSTNPWVPGTSTSSWVENSATPSLGTTVVSEITYGLSPSPGSAGTISRSDHTHGTQPLTTNFPSTQAIGDSAVVGTGVTPARDDHKHAMPSFNSVTSALTYGISASSGSAVTVARSDHTHGTPSLTYNTPVAEATGSTALVGTGVLPAKDDHRHGMPTATQFKTDLLLPTDTVSSLSTLTTNLATETTNRTTADTTESNARTAADTTLTTNLNNETTNRTNADNTLTTNLNTETTNRTNADTTETNARIAADATLQSDVNTRVLRAGDTMTGVLYAPAYVNTNTEAEKCWSINWANNTANQKVDLYFSANTVPMNGLIDVFLSSSIGTVTKRFALGISGATATQNTSRYTDVMGTAPNFFAISDCTYDATNSRWRIKLVQRGTMAAIYTAIFVNFIQAPGNADVLLPTFGMSSIYTTDTTSYVLPIVSYEGALVVQSIQTSFKNVPPTQSTTITLTDSIILAGSGASTVLPSAVIAGGGRTYIVKNIGTSGVTVTSAGGTIDAASSYTIGNRSYNTFMSDGVNWWVVS